MRKTMRMVIPVLVALACADRTETADTSAAVATTPVAGATTQASSGDVQPGSVLLDPNSAPAQQLAAGTGLDSAAAAALVAARPFADMVAVDKALAARNLTADQRKAIYTKVWKKIDLNTATGEEILLIPGVGNRMKHEFEEYRPYTSMEQFRREIGKYVDKAEVARLEQYVMIK
jgi:DNA uptake protein ComE-like DNA-binding protein